MLDHAREAADLARSHSRSDLDTDRLLGLGLVRLLEIVGEAAGRISEELRAEQTSIPWPRIVGLRNRLIHGYDSVDMDILWEILTNDLPPLIESLQAIPGIRP
jgi:uncharacterized protein with HEPN domain